MAGVRPHVARALTRLARFYGTSQRTLVEHLVDQAHQRLPPPDENPVRAFATKRKTTVQPFELSTFASRALRSLSTYYGEPEERTIARLLHDEQRRDLDSFEGDEVLLDRYRARQPITAHDRQEAARRRSGGGMRVPDASDWHRAISGEK